MGSSHAVGRHCTEITDFLFAGPFNIRNHTVVRAAARPADSALIREESHESSLHNGISNARAWVS